jgi:spore coat polysaccharide biosynthesis predicted glycosyltransferase SpsG
LRADGNSQIGLGHVYRLLALAEMLKDEFGCFFAINNPDTFTLQQIEKTCKGPILLNNNKEYVLPHKNRPGEEMDFDLDEYLTGSEIVVTDGYLFGENYQSAVKAKGSKLVCIDDLAESDFFADVIINHAPGVKHSDYKKQKCAQLFTGLDYAIIRQPFLTPIIEKKNFSLNAFISLGGSDYFRYSERLLDLTLRLNLFESVHVLCSSSFSNELLGTLKKMEAESTRIKLHFNLDANQLVRLLDTCTHAFIAASTVLIEAYSRGLKCFAGFYTRNQQFMYQGFIKGLMAAGLGNFNVLNERAINTAMEYEPSIIPLRHSLASQKNLRVVFAPLL